MKNSNESVEVVSKVVIDFLSKKYGIVYLTDSFIEEVNETVEWFDLDILKSISHLVSKSLSLSIVLFCDCVIKYYIKNLVVCFSSSIFVETIRNYESD